MTSQTKKETIEKLCFAISGWATRRGKFQLVEDEKNFNRCDKIVDHWIDELVKEIIGEWKHKESNDWVE